MYEPISDAKGLFSAHFGIEMANADLRLLAEIVSSYSSIPYENLTKIIRKFTIDDPARRLRDPVEVMRGYIEDGTGGTCFSLCWCLGSILSGAGFRCYPVMADMKRANIHCALVVHCGTSRYMVDPGYLLGGPVELSGKNVRLPTPFGTVELRPRTASSYDLYTVTGEERKWRYRVRTEPVPAHLFMRYWKESFSLPMMNSLQLTKLTGKGHLYVRDHHLSLRTAEKRMNENIKRKMESRIEAEFGIDGRITSRAREYIERLKDSRRADLAADPAPEGRSD